MFELFITVKMSVEGCVNDVVQMLRFFAEIRNYSYIDRIANSLRPEIAEIALLEAMRHLRSLYDSAYKKENLNCVKINDEKKILPKIPSKDCMERIIQMMWESESARRRIAILALSYGR